MKKYIMFVVLMMGTACMVFISGVKFPTPLALMVLICAVGADFLTTYLCLRARGKEGNPVIAFLLKRIGIWGTFGLMACVWLVFIMLRWLPSDLGSQTAIACTYWLVPINNLMVLKRLSRACKNTSA